METHDDLASSAENADAPEAEKPPSRLYSAISSLAFLLLIVSFFAVCSALLITLDFLDIMPFRYYLPESFRQKWPISSYFQFIKLHQLPDEERFQVLARQNKEEYQRLISSGTGELRQRAEELEKAYKELVKKQDAEQRSRQQELLAIQEENLKMKTKLEQMERDLTVRKDSVEVISRQVASEAINIETSLIRFMEEDNRLKPVQEMTAAMDPRSIAAIFDEVSDNKLIYDIMKGIPPERSALILSYMDPEKAGKIVKMSQVPPTLPAPGSSRSYLPSSLQNLVASSQALAR